jgi:hypothetical protein
MDTVASNSYHQCAASPRLKESAPALTRRARARAQIFTFRKMQPIQCFFLQGPTASVVGDFLSVLSPKLFPIFISLLLAGCGDSDRTVVVACDPALRGGFSFDFQTLGVRSATVGVLNTQALLPGVILEIKPSTSTRGVTVLAAYAAATKREDFEDMRLDDTYFVRLSNAGFSIQAEEDVLRSAQSLSITLTETITKNTAARFSRDTRLRLLRDPFGFLSANEQSVDFIRKSGLENRFVLVSAVLYASDLDFNYTEDMATPPWNLLKVGNFYLHVAYSCNEAMHHFVASGGFSTGKPLLFFFVPVTYDEIGNRIRFDTRSIDFSGAVVFPKI